MTTAEDKKAAFEAKKVELAAKKAALAAGAASTDEEKSEEAETAEGEEASVASAPAVKPKLARAGRPVNDPDAITVVVNAHEFTVPSGSTMGKQLSKLSKAHAAVAAALAGE